MDRDPERLMKQFQQQKDVLQEEITTLLDRSGDPEHRGDSGDLAAAESNRHNKLVIVDRKRTEIKRIEAAIRTLRNDPENYGICKECGEPIPVERLMRRPHTLHCVSCKTALEKENGQGRMMQPAWT